MYIALGIIILAIVAAAIIFRKTEFVKKNWKYLLILIPAAVIITLKIIQNMKDKTKTEEQKATELQQTVSGIKDQLWEAGATTKIEVAAAREKNEEVLKKLEEIKKITDGEERRRQLAEMIN